MHNSFVTPFEILREDLNAQQPRRSAPERLRFSLPALPVAHVAAADAARTAPPEPAKSDRKAPGLRERFRRKPMPGPVM